MAAREVLNPEEEDAADGGDRLGWLGGGDDSDEGNGDGEHDAKGVGGDAEGDASDGESEVHVDAEPGGPDVVGDRVPAVESSDAKGDAAATGDAAASYPSLVRRLETTHQGSTRVVWLIGTAHVSKASSRDACAQIAAVQPPCVFVELCNARRAMLRGGPQKPQDLAATIEAIKRGESLFAAFYGYFGASMSEAMGDVDFGGEFRAAKEEGDKYGAALVLGDRPLGVRAVCVCVCVCV
jgi:hypothetical protein